MNFEEWDVLTDLTIRILVDEKIIKVQLQIIKTANAVLNLVKLFCK